MVVSPVLDSSRTQFAHSLPSLPPSPTHYTPPHPHPAPPPDLPMHTGTSGLLQSSQWHCWKLCCCHKALCNFTSLPQQRMPVEHVVCWHNWVIGLGNQIKCVVLTKRQALWWTDMTIVLLLNNDTSLDNKGESNFICNEI